MHLGAPVQGLAPYARRACRSFHKTTRNRPSILPVTGYLSTQRLSRLCQKQIGVGRFHRCPNHCKLRDTRRLVEARPKTLRSMLNGEARLAARKLRSTFKRSRSRQREELTSSGMWDLLGSVRIACNSHKSEENKGDDLSVARMVPGARIELATPAFSGRRSTNELPRHY